MNRGLTKLEVILDIRIVEIALISLLLFAYVINMQLLVLLAFGIASGILLLSPNEDSIDFLFFLTPFARLFTYQGKDLFFVMAGLFIFRFLAYRRVHKATLCFLVMIVMYCFVFCDYENRISFTNVVALVYLFVIPVIGAETRNIECRRLMQHYIFGFVISTVIGYFAMRIPAIARLFEYDLVWTGETIDLTRFCGLAFDSNFYALSNYIILAYLLLAFKKLDKYRVLLIIFLIISGLQTVSKSYFLVLMMLLTVYLLRSAASVKQLIISIGGILVGAYVFAYVSNKIGYNVVELVTDRFVIGGSLADNTTGRTEIWNAYLEVFSNASVKDFVFGHGFNAVVTRAAHNTFVEFLFFYGVVGCILWGAYFVYCWKVFCNSATSFENKSSMVLMCLLLGIFFLSAYTYESFWVGIVVSFLAFKNTNKVRMSI